MSWKALSLEAKKKFTIPENTKLNLHKRIIAEPCHAHIAEEQKILKNLWIINIYPYIPFPPTPSSSTLSLTHVSRHDLFKRIKRDAYYQQQPE